MELPSLPFDIFQLIALLLSDEDKESLSCTSRALCSLMQRLYDSTWFWRERYTRAHVNTWISSDRLLSVVIDHYGWRKLWFRTRDWSFDHEDNVFIGSTGNIFIRRQEQYVHIDIIAMSRSILIKRKDNVLVILYLDLEEKPKFLIVTDLNQPRENIFTMQLANSSTIDSYISPECHILILDDGAVIIIHRTHDKLLTLVNAVDKSVPWHDVGVNIIPPLCAGFSIIQVRDENVSVDVFEVIYYKNKKLLFSSPRSSATYLKLLQQEINQRLMSK